MEGTSEERHHMWVGYSPVVVLMSSCDRNSSWVIFICCAQIPGRGEPSTKGVAEEHEWRLTAGR